MNHRLFGTSRHSVYPRYMGGGSMLWESQTVWDQWTFSVSQVHGGGLHVRGMNPGNHRLFGTSGHSVYPRYMGGGAPC